MSDLKMAVSEETVNDLLSVLLDEQVTTFDDQAQGDFGPFSAGYHVSGHFELDAVDFRNNPDRVKIDELDVVWDRFDVWLDVDIPEICIGGFCIIPWFGGCAVRAPRKCFFQSSTDIHIPLRLGGLVRSEVSALLALTVDYKNHRGSKDYLEAQQEEHQRLQSRPPDETGPLEPPSVNSWDVSFYPDTLDIDLFDIADMVGDLLQDAIDAVIDGLLGGLPKWAKDVLRSIFGSFVDMVRAVLDLPDDLGEWLSDLIGVSLDLEGFLIELLDQFFVDYPALRIEDPYPVLDWSPPLGTPASGSRLIPVKVPIEDLEVDVADTELVVTGDVGDAP